MSASAPGGDAPEERLNLARVVVLLVEPNVAEQDLLVQMLTGFGVRNVRRCQDTLEARSALATLDVGLIVLDASAPDGRAYDFVAWLRREAPDSRRFLPVLMLKGHVQASQVRRARDCGANFVIAKPISARVLLDRISWLGSEPRGFLAIEGGYAGPDRRFRTDGPPPGAQGRRKEDAPADPAHSLGPDMA
ncbi:MAG: response regulator [Caulobacteraceae bacterium]|nr:response regulator [Caulobacter sp.]